MTVNCLTEQPRHGGVHGDFHVTRKIYSEPAELNQKINT